MSFKKIFGISFKSACEITGAWLAICGFVGYTSYGVGSKRASTPPATRTVQPVHASSALVAHVHHADVNYLDKIGDKKAKIANRQASRFGVSPLYTKWKDGRYWSYLEDHQPIGNDVFDAASAHQDAADQTGYSNNGSSHSGPEGTSTDASRYASGIIANEKVLRAHGVKSGINFFHFDRYANDTND